MRLERMGVAAVLAAWLAVLPACVAENRAAPQSGSQGAIVKGGDDRTGEYEAVENWWKPAPDHEAPWTWGQVSGVAVDNPDRIIVAVWGDRDSEGRERPGGTNYLVVVDRNGNIVDRKGGRGRVARTTSWSSIGTATSWRGGRISSQDAASLKGWDEPFELRASSRRR